MGIPIQMKVVYNVKHHCTIRLKFRDKIFYFSNQVSALNESQ